MVRLIHALSAQGCKRGKRKVYPIILDDAEHVLLDRSV